MKILVDLDDGKHLYSFLSMELHLTQLTRCYLIWQIEQVGAESCRG